MKHLFLNKDLSLLAKKKGFNEPCMAYHTEMDNLLLLDGSVNRNGLTTCPEKWVLAPIYQQVVDWFMDRHGLYINIFPYDDENYAKAVYGINIIQLEFGMYKECHVEISLRTISSYYEALNKAIEQAFKMIK